MKKYEVVRKIRVMGEGFTSKEETIKAYKYNYKDIEFAIYNTKDYDDIHKGYISIIVCDNVNCNGLGLCVDGFKTIKECYNKTTEIIDKCYEQILKIIEEK